MHPIAAFCRRNLNALGLELYSIAYPLLPKDRRDWLFEKNVNIVPAETGVKIIDKDEESITIGKFNKDGTYSDKPFRILTTTDIHLARKSYCAGKARSCDIHGRYNTLEVPAA